jgi:hypothetical protein
MITFPYPKWTSAPTRTFIWTLYSGYVIHIKWLQVITYISCVQTYRSIDFSTDLDQMSHLISTPCSEWIDASIRTFI